MKQSEKIALCGIVGALSVVCMFATGIVPFATYALPALAGLLLLPLVIQCGKKWALGAYVAVSLLSLLLSGDKEATMMYIALLGYYPIVKAVFEQRMLPFWSWVCKFALFNITMIGIYAVAMKILMFPSDIFSVGGVSLAWAFLLIGNFVFWVYDLAITRLVEGYIQKVMPKLSGVFRVKK